MTDFQIKRGDLLPELQITLLDSNGNPVDLTLASTAKLAMRLVGATTPVIYAAMDIASDQSTVGAGIVTYTWQTGDTDAPGEYQAEVVVDWDGNGKEQTFPTVGFNTITIEDDLESHVGQLAPEGFRVFSTAQQTTPQSTTTRRLGA